MPEFFSSDGSFLLQFVVIFLVILVLLMGAALLFRRLVGRGLSVAARTAKPGRQPRLGIVDIYELDRQRQLILLRRDNVEHLLLVGGPNDVVVERNVQRAARLPSEGLLRPDIAEDEAARPDLPGGPDEDRGTHAQATAPSFEMPVVVPPPLPGSRNQAPILAPSLDPRLFEADEGEAEMPAPSRTRASRLLRRTPPPLAEPRPEPASERPAGAPPVMAASEPRPVDPAVLSDMAHQLEVALRRPASAVTPPPSHAPSSQVEPPPAPVKEPPRVADPVAAGMAAAQVLSPTEPVAASPVPAALAGTDRPATPKPASDAEMGRAPPAEPTPKAPPAAPAPPQPKPAKPASEQEPGGAEASRSDGPDVAKAKPQPNPTPFSVEEIEAEFARLLGRPVDKKP